MLTLALILLTATTTLAGNLNKVFSPNDTNNTVDCIVR